MASRDPAVSSIASSPRLSIIPPMTAPAPSIEIRSAALEDAARIRDLTRAAYAKWAALIGREPLPMQADYDRALREHAIDLLTVGGALAGLIETIMQADHLWIENVAVAPHQQGRGYGRLLLAHAEKRAAEAGRGEIRLQTNAAFAANLALYVKLGYAIDRTEPFRGGTAVYMSKRIDAEPPG
jgi:GNAT superfamily N-acetyltransferase